MNEFTRTDNYGTTYYKDKAQTIHHREDGPAVECHDGGKWWYLNDKRHRIDGPAVEYKSGTKSWYINGVLIFKTNDRGEVVNRMK